MHLGVSARTTGPPNKGRISYGCWARSGQGLMFNDGKEPLETFKYLQKDPELWEALIKKERSEAKEQRRNRPASPEPLALDDDDSRMRVTLSQDVLEDPQFVGRRTPSSPTLHSIMKRTDGFSDLLTPGESHAQSAVLVGYAAEQPPSPLQPRVLGEISHSPSFYGPKGTHTTNFERLMPPSREGYQKRMLEMPSFATSSSSSTIRPTRKPGEAIPILLPDKIDWILHSHMRSPANRHIKYEAVAKSDARQIDVATSAVSFAAKLKQRVEATQDGNSKPKGLLRQNTKTFSKATLTSTVGYRDEDSLPQEVPFVTGPTAIFLRGPKETQQRGPLTLGGRRTMAALERSRSEKLLKPRLVPQAIVAPSSIASGASRIRESVRNLRPATAGEDKWNMYSFDRLANMHPI